MSKRNPNQRARGHLKRQRIQPNSEAKAALLAQLDRMAKEIMSGRLRLDKTTGTLVRHKPYWWRFGR